MVRATANTGLSSPRCRSSAPCPLPQVMDFLHVFYLCVNKGDLLQGLDLAGNRGEGDLNFSPSNPVDLLFYSNVKDHQVKRCFSRMPPPCPSLTWALVPGLGVWLGTSWQCGEGMCCPWTCEKSLLPRGLCWKCLPGPPASGAPWPCLHQPLSLPIVASPSTVPSWPSGALCTLTGHFCDLTHVHCSRGGWGCRLAQLCAVWGLA